jgi:glucosyl-3-phosphoglycerate synthase
LRNAEWQDAGCMLRSFDARDLTPEVVAAAKVGRRVSVCIPARNEEESVGAVVGCIREELMGAVGVVDELVVVDDGSTDGTAAAARAAGAEVVAAAGILPGHPTGPGKGEALWRGAHVTTGDVVVFCDADVSSFHAGFVLGLAGPLLRHPDLALVKGHYERPIDGKPSGGGRVTELVARPLVSLLHPYLAGIIQPLAGEFALRRDVLEAVPFVGGYGVDLGLLIDVAAAFGPDSLAQADLGTRAHRNRSLAELSEQATAVMQVAVQRAGLTRGGHRLGGTLPWSTPLARPGAQPVDVTMVELPPLVGLAPPRPEPSR